MKRKTTITIGDAELEIDYYFQPEEKAETGPEAQYPGCGAEWEVNAVVYEGKDITDAIEAFDLFDKIVEKLIEEEGKSYD